MIAIFKNIFFNKFI